MKSLVIVLFFLWLGVTGCQFNPTIDGREATMKRVVSANTIEVIIDQKAYRLRLSGVETPSSWQNKGKEFLENLFTLNNTFPLKSANVIIESDLDSRDQYNRITGYAWFHRQLVNRLLIKEGYSIVNLDYTDGKYDRLLLNGQEYARIMGKGMWSLRD